jgi:hypothetical protein
MPLSHETKVTLNGVAEVLRKFQPGAQRLEIPAPVVNVELPEQDAPVVNNEFKPEIVVNCDLQPLAEAINKQTETFQAAILGMLSQLSQAVAVLASNPPHVHLPEIRPNISVAAPQVDVHHPAQSPKKFHIKHHDGTESVFTELMEDLGNGSV